MNIVIPSKVLFIIDTLNSKGYKAYAVGGCVRDSLIKRTPSDWDLSTDASPQDIIDIFPRTVPTGIAHGTITVLVENESFEVTTFREDGDYSDGRHPDSVTFTTSILEDLSRRDFTINAMAYHPLEGLIDPYGGYKDIEAKRICAVGAPEQRFHEDALRMLRAVRFSSQLQFEIENNTLEAISKSPSSITRISKERIRDELCKLLMTPSPAEGIRLLSQCGLLQYILPDLTMSIGFQQRNPHHHKDVFDHTLLALENTAPRLNLRLSALLHDVGKPFCFSIDKKGIGHFYGHNVKSSQIAERLLKSLKFDNHTIKTVCILIKEHMSSFNKMEEKALKKMIVRIGIENLRDYFDLLDADMLAHKPPHDLQRIEKLKDSIMAIVNKKDPLTVRDLDINGEDLMKIGYSAGRELGRTLDYLLDIVLSNPKMNTKPQLLKLAEEALKR